MESLKNAKDFWNNSYLFIMLGPQCNMCCRHCSQVPYKPYTMFIKDEISDDVMQLIGSYIEYYQNRKGDFKKAKILFWGGEALLHWDLIKKIVPYFTDKYNMYDNDSVTFVVSSNGLLVTDEMVDFFNQYSVQFNLSFDSPYPFAVRGVVSEELVQKIKKIKKLCVLGSLNALNCDLFASLGCLFAKFGDSVSSIFFNFQLLYTFDLPKDICEFDFERVHKGLRMCRIAIQLGNQYYASSVLPLLKPIQHPETKKFTLDTGLRYCVPGQRYLTVTLDGKVVRCHNDASIQIGTVNDSLDDIFKNGLEICNKLQGDKQTLLCKECVHKDICPGGCMLGVRNEDGTYKACDKYVKPIYSILKDEMLKLNDGLSETDKKWFFDNLSEYEKMFSDFRNGKYENIKTK